jgi:hypothetical protein
MHLLRKYRLIPILAVFLMLLAMALPVLADQPVHFGPNEFTDEYDVNCNFYGYPFIMELRSDIKVHTTFFLDENGFITRAQYHFRGQDTVTNLSTGLVATGNFAFLYLDDADSLTETISGVDWMLRAPGRGKIFQSAGRYIIDYSFIDMDVIFEAGRHDFLEGGYAALCAAMS